MRCLRHCLLMMTRLVQRPKTYVCIYIYIYIERERLIYVYIHITIMIHMTYMSTSCCLLACIRLFEDLALEQAEQAPGGLLPSIAELLEVALLRTASIVIAKLLLSLT